MSFSKIASVAVAITFTSQILAHGTVTGIVADGVYYEGYSPSMQYLSTAPIVVGWSIPEDLSNGFIAPDAYNNSDIICHLNATNAQGSATVKAGGTVELQWTAWPSSHHGPVLDYLANCNGDCTTVNKNTLEFFKIDGVGLINDTTLPGSWASDDLIANNNTWAVTIPSTVAPGKYVLRHEIIALHSAGEVDGAQNYPQCVNLDITGSGTDSPSGELATAFYSETDPGIEINIYQSLSIYEVPGPTLYSGAAFTAAVTATASTSASASASFAAVATAPAASSFAASAAAAATSAVAVTSTTSSVTTAAAVVATSSAPDASIASSAIADLSTIIPSSALTAVISTATASSTSDIAAMPAGTTLEDLLSWLAILMEDVISTKSSVSRRHARDLAIYEAKHERRQFSPVGAVPSGGFAAPSGVAAPSYHHHRTSAHGTGAVGPMATGGAKYVVGGF